MKLPYVKKPCKDCPFRKDSLKGWLGQDRIAEILKQPSFVCHKNNELQCAGHMIIKGQDNNFVELASRMNINLDLSGNELVFGSKTECIEQHTT